MAREPEGLERLLSNDPVAFEDLVGAIVPFYGADGHRFKLGATVYEAIEDEQDGLRSCLDEICADVQGPDDVFFKKPIAEVRVEKGSANSSSYGEFEGWQLMDAKTNHCWLRLGTDMADGYYPFFVFDYEPDPQNTLTRMEEVEETVIANPSWGTF